MSRLSAFKTAAAALGFTLLAGAMTEAMAQVRWSARATCSVTGATGVASGHRSRSNAAAIAVRNCIRAGGIPACCRVTDLNAYRRR